MKTEQSVALHEAGHCIAAWHEGVKIAGLNARGLGGFCFEYRDQRPPAVSDVLISLAGPVAGFQLGGDRDDHLSAADRTYVDKAMEELRPSNPNTSLAGFEDLAMRFVFAHEKAIKWLAEKLLEQKNLDADALAKLIHEKNSPLALWRSLYPAPKLPQPNANPLTHRGRPARALANGNLLVADSARLRTLSACTSTARLSVGGSVGVDKKNARINGMVLAQAGAFKTPGRGRFDRKSLDAILALGKVASGGLRSNFTHGPAFGDSLGQHLGRVRDLRMDKAKDERTGQQVDAVRGNLYLDATALQPSPVGGSTPLGVYVLNLAASDPAALSSSLVLQADLEYERGKDGRILTDADGFELSPLWRPVAVFNSDIVAQGDAVDSLLSAR